MFFLLALMVFLPAVLGLKRLFLEEQEWHFPPAFLVLDLSHQTFFLF